MITVVLGANRNDPGDRFMQTQRLYQYLQTGVRLKKLKLSHGQKQVAKGNKRQVMVKDAPLAVWQSVKEHQTPKLHIHYRAALLARRGRLVAPIKKG